MKALAAFVAAALLVSGACWIVKSSFEARAFESATGKHVSTWDAMWVDLRVQEQAK